MFTVIKRAWFLASMSFLLVSLGFFPPCAVVPAPSAAAAGLPATPTTSGSLTVGVRQGVVRAQDPLDISTQPVYDPNQLLGSGLYQVTASAKTMENRQMHLLVAMIDSYGELTGTEWNEKVLELSNAQKDTYLISFASQGGYFAATASSGSRLSSAQVSDLATQIAAPMFSTGDYAQAITSFVSQLIDRTMIDAEGSSQQVGVQESTSSGMAKWVIVVLLLAMVASAVLALFVYRRNVGGAPAAKPDNAQPQQPDLEAEPPTMAHPQLQEHHLRPAEPAPAASNAATDPHMSAALAAKAAQEQRLAGLEKSGGRKARRQAKAQARAAAEQVTSTTHDQAGTETALAADTPVPAPPQGQASSQQHLAPLGQPQYQVPAAPPAPPSAQQRVPSGLTDSAQASADTDTPEDSWGPGYDSAAATLVSTDNALLAAAEDLEVSQEQFGPAATRSFAIALAEAQEKHNALLAQLASTDVDQATGAQLAAQSAEIAADLKRHVDSFTKLRHRPSSVDSSLQRIKERSQVASLALANAQATWQKVRQTYPRAELDFTQANLEHAQRLLTAGRQGIAAAEQKVAEKDLNTAIRYLRGAERAFTQTINASRLLSAYEQELSFTLEQLQTYPSHLQDAYNQLISTGATIAEPLAQRYEHALAGAKAALNMAQNPQTALDQLIAVTDQLATAITPQLGTPAGARLVTPSLPMRYDLCSQRLEQLQGHLNLRRKRVSAQPRALLAHSTQLAFEAQSRGQVDPLVAINSLSQSHEAAWETQRELPVTLN